MKKKAMFSLVLLFFSMSVWSEEAVEPQLVEIKCSIRPIDRSKIHPSGNYATSQSTTSPTSQSSSSNWSGYVAATDFTGTSANGTVSYVAGSWVVPTIKASTDTTYCAIWVGIDGFLSDSVEQIGTSHNWVDGAQQNYAWFEMYPNGSYEISGFPVDNGDVISARVGYKGNDTFKLVISNLTKGVSTVIPSSNTMSTSALRSSAEWVVEAPYSGMILPLADFKLVTLNYCSAVINGVSGTINNGEWMNDEIVMETQKGIEAQPSALLKNGSCFQVAWQSE
ncbi:MAG: G1 family glutamic endopeptidase [Rhabdochlamydiaceae bacterium]